MGFTDLMSSGRGPGLIGTLLAVIVLAGFSGLFLFALDEGQYGAEQSIESLIATQAKEIDAMARSMESQTKELSHAPRRKAAMGELSGLEREIKSRDTELAGLGREVTSAQGEVTAKLAEFDAYKDQYRAIVRAKAKGSSLPQIKTRDGQTYANVTVREVNAVGMQIIHDGGNKRIPFEELPGDLQDLYQFDASQKAAAIAKEAKERQAHEAEAAAAEELADRQADLEKVKQSEAAREQAAEALAVAKAKLVTLAEEIDALEQAIEVEVRKPVSRAPQMRQQVAGKRREMANIQAAIERMAANR